MDYNTTRLVDCVVCGRGFKDDCGDSFCSNHCESEYNRAHSECEQCGGEYHEDDLNHDNICENCEEENDEN